MEPVLALGQHPDALAVDKVRQADGAVRLRPGQAQPRRVRQRRYIGRRLRRGLGLAGSRLVPAPAKEVADRGLEGEDADDGADEDDEDGGQVGVEVAGVPVREPAVGGGGGVGGWWGCKGCHGERVWRRLVGGNV